MNENIFYRVVFSLFLLNILLITLFNSTREKKDVVNNDINKTKYELSLKMNLAEKIDTSSTFCEMATGKLSYEEKMECIEVAKPTVCQDINGEQYFCKEQPDLSAQLNKN